MGESQIAQALGDIQQANPSVDIGSYPFFRESRYGTNLVIRGADLAAIDAAAIAIMAAVTAAGETPEDLGEE
jgi:molybdopterin-biosynthesis enzyme MoeA-like protein